MSTYRNAPSTGYYSSRARWLPCDACGVGIQCPIEGGTTACPKCGAPFAAYARPDSSVPPSRPGDEAARLARLRAQDGKPMLPPPGFEQLVSGSEVPPHKLQEAQMVWSATRKAVAADRGDLGAADRLVFLTMVLRNTYQGKDEARVRAVIEGALEVLMLPRHRQIMRGHLSRSAVREGDLASAEEWLRGCDPYSDDLHADTAYRVSHACLSTARRQWNDVINMLGGTFEDVPIDDAYDAVATVFRANAWEKLGQVQAAQAVLAAYMSRGGAAAVVESVATSLPAEWQVCAQSLPRARQDVRQAVGQRAASGTALFGWIFLFAGMVPLVILVVMILSGEFVGPMLTMLLFPIIFGTIGIRSIRAAARAKEIARDGSRGRGRILAVSPTGTRINNVPVMRFDLEVTVDGRPPLRASATKLMMPQGGLVGAEIPVIWHPKYPDDVVMEI